MHLTCRSALWCISAEPRCQMLSISESVLGLEVYQGTSTGEIHAPDPFCIDISHTLILAEPQPLFPSVRERDPDPEGARLCLTTVLKRGENNGNEISAMEILLSGTPAPPYKARICED